MPRYIDATDLVRRVLEERDRIPLTVIPRYNFGVPEPCQHGQSMRGGIRKALHCIETSPTVDVEPVRHGRWVETKTGFHCSVCKKKPGRCSTKRGADLSEYCHRCGAKMDGDVDAHSV